MDERARVKAINDLVRTSLMNRKYYARRLAFYTRLNRSFDLGILIGSSSVIAGWGIWKATSAGSLLWGVLAGLASLATIIKQTLELPKEIERYSKLHLGYCSLYYDLDSLAFDLQLSKSLSEAQWNTFLHLRKRNNDLGVHDELTPHLALLRECQAEVLQELPKGRLWLPPGATQIEIGA